MIHLTHHQQEHNASCLAACVVMILQYWKTQVAESEIRRILKTKMSLGTHPVNLLHLSTLGFQAWPYEGALADLQARVHEGTPVIVFLWTGRLSYWAERVGVDYLHTVVVVGYNDVKVIVHDPVLSEGPIEILWDEFKSAWQYTRQMMAVVEPT